MNVLQLPHDSLKRKPEDLVRLGGYMGLIAGFGFHTITVD